MLARDIGDPAIFAVSGAARANAAHWRKREETRPDNTPDPGLAMANVWITSRCAAAATHYDISHNFHVVLHGVRIHLRVPLIWWWRARGVRNDVFLTSAVAVITNSPCIHMKEVITNSPCIHMNEAHPSRFVDVGYFEKESDFLVFDLP
jgi:hypothetical protein